MVELLTQNWALSCDLRVPAISRLQKIHNVEVAFKTLKDRGIDVEGTVHRTRAVIDWPSVDTAVDKSFFLLTVLANISTKF